MTWIDLTLLLIPRWLLVLMGVMVVFMSLVIWGRGKGARVVDSWYFLAVGMGYVPISIFYFMLMVGALDVLEDGSGVAFSRLTFGWLLFIKILVLGSIHRNNGLWKLQ